MAIFSLLSFCVVLLVCISLKAPILYALGLGLCIFIIYAMKQGFPLKEVLLMCLRGIKTARNVLITFFLIGLLTAFWRAAGTIPVIVTYAGGMIQPSLFLLTAFVLNCMVSMLTGTSFGTAATMGVVCATMGSAMRLPPALIGGAVLAGAFFGDRCSPVSTSCLLVSELTEMDIFDNIRRMLKSALVPFVLSCIAFFFVGRFTPFEDAQFDFTKLFGAEFQLHWIALIPALVIVILSVFRTPTKKNMAFSILSALPIAFFLQKASVNDLLSYALWGYRAKAPELAAMVNGGGVISMLNVAAIVCISSAYSGIFQKTDLLSGMQSLISKAAEKITAYGAMLFTSVLTGAIACNQTLSIILTKQICEGNEQDKSTLALDLEDTAVITAALIPWSIASAVPLTSIHAPTSSLLFAFFLYILPIWRFLMELRKRALQKTK